MIGIMGSQRVTQLREAMCLLECVECIRAVMNSRVGLEFFIHHKQPIQQLVVGELKVPHNLDKSSFRR